MYLRLNNHRACVNGIAWAPHSSCHICTAGDDHQVTLIFSRVAACVSVCVFVCECLCPKQVQFNQQM